MYLLVLYLLVVLGCKIAEVGFGWWAAAMIGLIVITTDPPQASHYQCHMSFKSKLNLSNPSSPITIPTHPPRPLQRNVCTGSRTHSMTGKTPQVDTFYTSVDTFSVSFGKVVSVNNLEFSCRFLSVLCLNFHFRYFLGRLVSNCGLSFTFSCLSSEMDPQTKR